MVEDGHHEERIPTNPVGQGVREPAEQDAAAVTRGRGECLWNADCGRYCGIDSTSELEAEAIARHSYHACASRISVLA